MQKEELQKCIVCERPSPFSRVCDECAETHDSTTGDAFPGKPPKNKKTAQGVVKA